MTSFSQDNRPMRLHVPSLADNRLLLAGVDGEEIISQLFRYTLDVRASRSDDIDFDQLLGKDLRLDSFDASGSVIRRLHGIVAEVSETGRDADFVRLQIEMAPRLWLLTQTLRSRIFQEATVVDIVERVLKEHSIPLMFRLHETYPVRNYTTQYQESDFEFISRLLEDNGIHYYFESDADGSRVVFADHSTTAATILQSAPIEFRAADGAIVGDKFHINEWRPTVRLRPSKFLTRDHSFHLPNKPLESRDSLVHQVAVGSQQRRLTAPASESLLQYEYPGDYAKLFDACDQQASLDQRIAQERERTIRVRAQEQACRGIEIVGRSNCPALSPGYQFKLAGHGKSDGNYFVTSVYQSLRMPEYRANADQTTDYECSFECLPAGLPYRPRRDTPQPAIHGSQTATVVGGPEGEVAIDKYGRIKVHFHWDLEGSRDGHDSCWIRVASPWAGQGWGMVSHPRVGQEVVVDFQDGDPDRPLVIGSVYNPEQPTPYGVPERRNEMCIKSRTVGGDAGDFHGLSLNDTHGSELFRLRSQKDMVVEVKNRHHLAVPNAQTTVAGSLNYAQTGALIGRHFTGDSTDANGWQGVKVGAGIAYRVDTTFGGSSHLAMGFATQQYVGAFHRVFVSPVAVLGALPLPGASALAGMLGKSEVSHGGENMLVYGPQFHCYHGPKKERNAAYKELPAVASLAMMHSLATITNVITPGLVDCWDVGIWKMSVTLSEGLETLLLGMLTLAEELAGQVEELETISDQTADALSSSLIPGPGGQLVADLDDIAFAAHFDVLQAKIAKANMTAAKKSTLVAMNKSDDGQSHTVNGPLTYAVKGDHAVDATGSILMSTESLFGLKCDSGVDIEVLTLKKNAVNDSDSDSDQLMFTTQPSSDFVHRLAIEPEGGFSLSTNLANAKKQLSNLQLNDNGFSVTVGARKKKANLSLEADEINASAQTMTLGKLNSEIVIAETEEKVTITAKEIEFKTLNGTNSIKLNANGIFFNGNQIEEKLTNKKTTKAPSYDVTR